jgi:hypothetical protein
MGHFAALAPRYGERMKRVIVGYPRTEQKFAEELRDLLCWWNYETWVDIDNIPIGAYWPDEIDKGLNSCHVVLGVISPVAVASRKVKNEWGWALIHNNTLILLKCAQCYIPSNYISINYIEFSKDPQQGFEDLRISPESRTCSRAIKTGSLTQRRGESAHSNAWSSS